MVNKLKKASIVFWIICGISLVLALWGNAQLMYNDPGIVELLYVIASIIMIPIFYESTEAGAIFLCYLSLAIPVIFACFAIVLRMIAKAFDEQTITTIEMSK